MALKLIKPLISLSSKTRKCASKKSIDANFNNQNLAAPKKHACEFGKKMFLQQCQKKVLAGSFVPSSTHYVFSIIALASFQQSNESDSTIKANDQTDDENEQMLSFPPRQEFKRAYSKYLDGKVNDWVIEKSFKTIAEWLVEKSVYESSLEMIIEYAEFDMLELIGNSDIEIAVFELNGESRKRHVKNALLHIAKKM